MSRVPSFIQRDKDIIAYRPMSREGASMLVEFTRIATFRKAQEVLMKAYPGKMFLTGYSDNQMHQIVLNTDDELTYFKLIENDLR